MKKLNYLLLGLAGLTLASCSNNDDLQGPADGTYQLTVNLPKDMSTRAIGDEITANQVLNYTIFTENGDYVDSKTNVSFNGGTSMTLNLPLLKGNSYKIAFFAQSSQSSEVYTYNAQSSVVNVAYNNMTYGTGVDADAYDCFSGTYEIKNVSTGLTDNITLTRPVAQINWGTSDLSSGAVTSAFGTDYSNLRTSLSLNTYTTLNVIEGSYGNTEDVTIPATALPSTEESFPAASGFSYLAMQYVLAEAETAQTVNLELNVTSSETSSSVTPIKLEVNNAPLQANFRTNIYGSLLTDQANITVSLSSEWGGQTNLVWDGQTVTIPTIENNAITTDNPAVIAGIASMVKGGNDLEGVTITLTDDIDMGGYSFPGIGTATRASGVTGEGSTPFRGKFNGNGKTIKGLNISYSGSNSKTVAAFIPNIDGENASVENVTFSNVSINGGIAEQAGVVGLVTNGATVSGVNVTDGKITSSEAAGLVARILKNGSVTGCTNGADISVVQLNSSEAGQNAGGIVGAATYTEDGSVMTISDCVNNGTITVSGGKLQQSAGGIVGTSAANVSGCINNGAVNVPTGSSIGGIVGTQYSAGSITGCTNKGTVTGNHQVGGILGFLSYTGIGSSYVSWNVITVTYNNSEGNVIATGGSAGGILGLSQNKGILSNNNVTAESITATGTAAGLVGSCSASTGSEGYKGGLTVNNNYVSESTKLSGATSVPYINGSGYTEEGNNQTTPNTQN